VTILTSLSSISIIDNDMLVVDDVIRRRLQSDVPLINNVSNYIIGAGGKRIRPKILLLLLGMYGYKGTHNHSMAAVVEFIHTATLLHDDVVDDSMLRRGNATANAKFGNPASVLVGDFLYSRAFQMMVEVNDMRIMKTLADATNIIAEGEVLQIINMHDPHLTEAGYFQVIKAKTATLFEASARVAAILSGLDEHQEKMCAQYGQSLGVAFQIVDDLLDYIGNAALMGKNVGADFREGKMTLLLIIAMQLASKSDRAFIEKAIINGEVTGLETVIRIVQESGALKIGKARAEEQVQLAIDACAIMPQNEWRDVLIELAQQSLDRVT
jgi:octaprenyl-diphosphate synthase